MAKKYPFSKNSDFDLEEKIPFLYTRCYDGLSVTYGSLYQHTFDDSFDKTITIPEEIDGLPITELRTSCIGVCNICSVGIKRVSLTITPGYNEEKTFYCSPPNIYGGMQYTIEKMDLVFKGSDMHLSSFADTPYLYSLSFSGTLHSDEDWECDHFRSGIFKNCINLRSILGRMEGYMISGSTFRNCTSLEVLPDMYIRYMSDYEFENCVSLKHVHLHDGLSNIGYHAFENCTSLSDIYVPDTVSKIEPGAFINCVSLEKIHLPDDIDEIPKEVFSRCVKLKKVFIPRKVTSIGSMAFYECTDLTDIFIPDGVTVINDEAFLSSGLKTIRTSSGLETIGRRAFADCKQLTKFFIPENTSHIGDLCFEGCTSLKKCEFPKKQVLAKKYFSIVRDLKQSNYPNIL